MFLHVSVILFTRLGVCQTPPSLGRHPVRQTPPYVETPRKTPQADPPRQTPRLPPGQPLQRTVRILPECFLVIYVHAHEH